MSTSLSILVITLSSIIVLSYGVDCNYDCSPTTETPTEYQLVPTPEPSTIEPTTETPTENPITMEPTTIEPTTETPTEQPVYAPTTTTTLSPSTATPTTQTISSTQANDDTTSATLVPSTTCPDNSFCNRRPDGNYQNPIGYPQNYFISCEAGQNLYCQSCPANLVYHKRSNSCQYRISPLSATSQALCPDNSFCAGKSNGKYQNPDGYSENYYVYCVAGKHLYCIEKPNGPYQSLQHLYHNLYYSMYV